VRRYVRRIKRRIGSQKIPLEVAVAGIAGMVTPVADGWASLLDYAKNGDFVGLGKALNLTVLGINTDGKLDIAGLLNPVAPQGRFIKTLIVAGLVHKVRTKLVKIPMKKVPILGRYIS
jgi:hypothetical protein